MIATILTTKCRERRNLGIIQPDKNPDIVFGSDQELRTMPTSSEHKTVQPPSPSGLRRSGARILEYAEAEGALLGQFPPSSRTTAGQVGANFSTTRRSLSAT